MFKVETPRIDDLPSLKQLRRSTIIAVAAAITMLITVVLPAEYGIDPTGIGRSIGLTEMGEIKTELRNEAEQDHRLPAANGEQSSVLQSILGLLVSSAQAEAIDNWDNEIEFALAPGETYEVKLTMNAGDRASYLMTVTGGRVNFDLHGHGNGQSVTYEKGRGSHGTEGEFVAAFPGGHGWFWRNRDKQEVTVGLKLKGNYSDLKQGR